MTNDEKLAKIKLWQTCGFVHPLTCRGGGGSCPGDAIDLEPVVMNDAVVLQCRGCMRIQQYIPECVFEADLTTHPFYARWLAEQGKKT